MGETTINQTRPRDAGVHQLGGVSESCVEQSAQAYVDLRKFLTGMPSNNIATTGQKDIDLTKYFLGE